MKEKKKTIKSEKPVETTTPITQVEVIKTEPTSPMTPTSSGMSGGAKIAIAAIILLFICSLCGVGGFVLVKRLADKPVNELEKLGKEIEKQEKENSKNLDNAKPMSETVDVDGTKWKVLEAKKVGETIKANSEYFSDCTAASGSEFIFVKVNIKNDTSESKSFLRTAILDGDNKKYDEYTGIFSCLNSMNLPDGDLFGLLESLEAGQSKDYMVYFEVPKDKSGLKLEVSNFEILNEQKDYIKLDL